MPTPGYGSNNRNSNGARTVAQQKNVDKKRGEQNAYAAKSRLAKTDVKYHTKSATPKGEIPGVKKPVYVAPTKKTGLKSKIKAAVKRKATRKVR
jgi:hypothetical protein